MSYPTGKNGRRYKSEGLQLWERDFEVWAFQNIQKVNACRRELETMPQGYFLAIDCIYYFERSQILTLAGKAKRLDIDNRGKHLIDEITRLMFVDDSLVWEVSFYKRVAASRASCSVQIKMVQVNGHAGETNSRAPP